MISRVRIQSFQSIDRLEIECGPVTVLVGESDVGKSAVVRALYALAQNDYPSNHVREGATNSAIEVVIDGQTIGAFKGGGVNRYEMDESVWERVGREVPPPVAEVLGWRMVSLEDGTKLMPSIARQFDGPFLLTETPQRAAKLVGTLTNITRLYEAIRDGVNLERRLQSEARGLEDQAAEIEDSIDGKAEGLEAEWEWLRGLEKVLEAAENRYARMTELGGLRLRAQQGADAVRRAREIEEAARRKAGPNLEVEIERLQSMRDLARRLQQAQKAYADANDARQSSRVAVERMTVALNELRASLDVCPLCGSDLSGHEPGVWPMSSQWGPS